MPTINEGYHGTVNLNRSLSQPNSECNPNSSARRRYKSHHGVLQAIEVGDIQNVPPPDSFSYESLCSMYEAVQASVYASKRGSVNDCSFTSSTEALSTATSHPSAPVKLQQNQSVAADSHVAYASADNSLEERSESAPPPGVQNKQGSESAPPSVAQDVKTAESAPPAAVQNDQKCESAPTSAVQQVISSTSSSVNLSSFEQLTTLKFSGVPSNLNTQKFFDQHLRELNLGRRIKNISCWKRQREATVQFTNHNDAVNAKNHARIGFLRDDWPPFLVEWDSSPAPQASDVGPCGGVGQGTCGLALRQSQELQASTSGGLPSQLQQVATNASTIVSFHNNVFNIPAAGTAATTSSQPASSNADQPFNMELPTVLGSGGGKLTIPRWLCCWCRAKE